jgi:hypothetical protein
MTYTSVSVTVVALGFKKLTKFARFSGGRFFKNLYCSDKHEVLFRQRSVLCTQNSVKKSNLVRSDFFQLIEFLNTGGAIPHLTAKGHRLQSNAMKHCVWITPKFITMLQADNIHDRALTKENMNM